MLRVMQSDKLRSLEAGIFSELAARKRAVKSQDVIDLSVGSPDLPPPDVVVKSLAEAVQDRREYGYTLGGSDTFHQAVALFYETRYEVHLDPSREVLQLMGSQDGLAHLPLALINPGDYVLVPDPGYPIYEASVRLAGGQPYPLPLLAQRGFLPDLRSIPADVLARTRLLILSYPGNPVTTLCTAAFFEEVVSFAKRHDILVAHDFAYSELVFDGVRPVSFLSVPHAKEVGVEFNSLSKTFNMAGCRIAYVCGHRDIIGALARLKSNIDYGGFAPIERAAVAALRSDPKSLTEQVRTYEARRDALVQGLAEAGWHIPSPQATMFAWAKLPDGWESREFAYKVLEEAGVAMTPGDAFGAHGEGYVRIALVAPAERLREAAQRIGRFLQTYAGR